MENRPRENCNDFKLSYPSNEKNPSIINCLKLCVDEKFGRHIITTRKLNPGDVVAIEKPFYKSPDKNAFNSRCLNCFKSRSNDFINCSSCNSVTFCSETCQNIAWKSFHNHECSSINDKTEDDGFLMMVERSLFKAISICGGIENLQKLIDGNENSSIFDIDVNENTNEVDKKLIQICHLNIAAPPTIQELQFVEKFVHFHNIVKTFWETKNQRDILINFLTKFIGILNRNSFTMHWPSSCDQDETGCGIFPFASLINHSCSPNLNKICIEDKIVFFVRRPIEENEQLFICYQYLHHQKPVQDRRKLLRRRFGFICSCEACEKESSI